MSVIRGHQRQSLCCSKRVVHLMREAIMMMREAIMMMREAIMMMREAIMMMREAIRISNGDHLRRSVQIRRHQSPSSAIRSVLTDVIKRNQANQAQSSAIKRNQARAHRRHERSLCRFAFQDQPCAQCRFRHAGSTKKSASAGSAVASNAARRFDSTCSSHLMKEAIMMREAISRRFDSSCS